MFLIKLNTMGVMDVRCLLSQNLEHVMELRGVRSQLELAKISGVSQTMIGMLLRAERDTTTGTLVKLAKALGVQPWCLLVNPENLDAAIAPGAARLLEVYARLSPDSRDLVLKVADAQALTGPQSASVSS